MKIREASKGAPLFKGNVDVENLAKAENLKYLKTNEKKALAAGASYTQHVLPDDYTVIFKRSKKNPELIDVLVKNGENVYGKALKGKRIDLHYNEKGIKKIGFQFTEDVITIIDKAVKNLEKVLGITEKKSLQFLTNLAKRAA